MLMSEPHYVIQTEQGGLIFQECFGIELFLKTPSSFQKCDISLEDPRKICEKMTNMFKMKMGGLSVM